MTNFELQLKEATKIFNSFLFQFVRTKSSKNLPTIFDYAFTFRDIGLY